MKKILGAVAAVAVLAPCHVWAQTTVNIYGRLDASLNYRDYGSTPGVGTKPGKASSTLSSVSSDTSFWGFRGVEDLGGGLRAYFKMENGFGIDTGAVVSTTSFFNREAYVGLGDAGLGSIQLGSQFSPAIALSAEFDPFQRSNIGGLYTLMQNSAANLRGFPLKYDNALQYLSPTNNDVVVRAMINAGEGVIPGPNYAASVKYTKQNLMLGSSYDRNRITSVSVGVSGSTVTSQTLSLTAKYDTSFGSLNAWAQTNRIPGLSSANGVMLGATYLMGSSELRASVARENVGTARGTLSSLGYFYLISKRTTLYTSVGHLSNQGTAVFSMGPSLTEGPPQGLPGKAQGISGVQLGMRTFF